MNWAQKLSKDVWPSNLGSFSKCFRLDSVFVGKTGLGRTGYLGVRCRHPGSVLPGVLATRRVPRCATFSALTGRGSAFLAGLGRTSGGMSSRARFCILFLGSTSRSPRILRQMLSRTRFCIRLFFLGLASWRRFFFFLPFDGRTPVFFSHRFFQNGIRSSSAAP